MHTKYIIAFLNTCVHAPMYLLVTILIHINILFTPFHRTPWCTEKAPQNSIVSNHAICEKRSHAAGVLKIVFIVIFFLASFLLFTVSDLARLLTVLI